LIEEEKEGSGLRSTGYQVSGANQGYEVQTVHLLNSKKVLHLKQKAIIIQTN
jgi:biotin operon repressor